MSIDITIWQLSLVFIAFFCGGFAKGALGFGLPLIALALMSVAIPVEVALALNTLPPLLLNIAQTGGPAHMRVNARRFWSLLAGIAAGMAASYFFISRASPAVFLAALGVATLIFCVLELVKRVPPMKPEWQNPLGWLVGGVAGIAAALTTVNGPLLVMYLSACRLSPVQFKRALSLIFLVNAVSLAALFAKVGFLTPTRTLLGLAATVPASLGMWAGTRYAARLDTEKFRYGVIVVLALIGADLIRRTLS